MKYCDRILWVKNIEKKMKAKGRLRFDVDLALFSIKKKGLLQTFNSTEKDNT